MIKDEHNGLLKTYHFWIHVVTKDLQEYHTYLDVDGHSLYEGLMLLYKQMGRQQNVDKFFIENTTVGSCHFDITRLEMNPYIDHLKKMWDAGKFDLNNRNGETVYR